MLNTIYKEINGVTNVLLSESEKVLQASIQSLQKTLNSEVGKYLAEILEQAKERLQDQGVKVNFKLPQLDRPSNISFTMEDLVSSGIEEYNYEKKQTRDKDGVFASIARFVWVEVQKHIMQMKQDIKSIFLQ